MNNRLTLLPICLSLFVLAACSTISPANPTPNIKPLSELNLESILLQPGDLPTIFVGQQIRSQIPKMFEDAPKPDQAIQQGFSAGEFGSDGITILLYSSLTDLEEVYNIVTKVVGEDYTLRPVSDLGEKALGYEEKIGGQPLIGGDFIPGATRVNIIFTRCHALVHIDLFSTEANMDGASTYGQRLDNRLSPLVCNQ